MTESARRDSPISSEVAFDEVEASELILVTTYTDPDCLAHTPKGENGRGIYAFDLMTSSGALVKRGALDLSPNPAFLVKHPSLPVIYGTTECIDKPGEVFSLRIDDRAEGGIKLMGRTNAGGRSTCYVNIASSERSMTVVNYWDAKVCVLPIHEDGSVNQIVSTHVQPGSEYVEINNPDRMEHWQYRQRWPHTHCAVTDPYSVNEDRVFVCDLGKDSIVHLRLEGTQLIPTGEVQLQKGLGPRHCVFHPRQRACYIVNELTSSVSFLKFNDKALNGQIEDSSTPGALLEHVKTISTLPADWQDKQTIKNGVWKAASHCSEIRLHPSGKLLFVGNRGHDSLAIFRIDEQDEGMIELASIAPSCGATPRNFNFASDGRWVIVGNQDSNNLTVFECNVDKGSLEKRHTVDCPSPNFVYAVPGSQTAGSNQYPQ